MSCNVNKLPSVCMCNTLNYISKIHLKYILIYSYDLYVNIYNYYINKIICIYCIIYNIHIYFSINKRKYMGSKNQSKKDAGIV